MIDTLKLTKRLTAAHMPAEQAEAISEVLADDVGGYESRFAKIEADLAVLKWMVGFNLLMTVALLWRVFTH